MLDVSVIIINYNSLKMTDECICSVIEKTSGISYEIILVDNASIDGSKEFFSKDKRVTYIYNDENLGFGRANNKGIEIAQGRNILFLNSDTLLRNNAIKILSDYLDNHPKVGACGGNLFLKDGTPGMSFGRYFPSLYEELNIFFECLPDKIIYGGDSHFNYTGDELKVGFILGADLMVKRSTLNAVGHFDPHFFLYYEETELCLRIKRYGKSIMSIPEAEIVHFDGGKKRINASHESYIQYRIQMERSRAIFYNLSYSNIYIKIAYSIRSFKCFLKQFSPHETTRIRWKEEKDLLKEGLQSLV